ncbi:MAG: GYF domain-containing protein [Pirellulaceae bacterium]|nr:GYF domain-containing protein [Pirellulaceae bacterium]
MADHSKWYYVEKGERQGPVATEVLKQLLANNTITPSTLLWKEGMKDWQIASTLDELVPPAPIPKVSVQPQKKTKSQPPRSAKKVGPDPVAMPKVTPAPMVVGPPAGTKATKQPKFSTPVPSSDSQLVVETKIPVSKANMPELELPVHNAAVGHRPHPILSKYSRIGYPCLIIGFMLVLSGKGCDSLGNRWASRLVANSQIAEQKFAAEYNSKINALQSQMDAPGKTLTPERLGILKKEMDDLRTKQSQERRRLQNSTWADLKNAASMASANNQSWGFFRELVFVLGSMVLATGLLVVGITGDGSEKWVCLVMLAIITFSLYIGGIAWLSSVTGNIPTAF